ncbi:MAG: ABC transporter permease, partial [Betaproteobacteria bacterium]
MSWSRFLAILIKEFRQVRRDRLTFGMMVGVPIIQLILFGFAINSDPKHLPLALIDADQSEFSRSFVAGLENSSYFEITRRASGEKEGDALLAAGIVQFVLLIPPDFSRKLIRGERPALLLAADATDPAATGNAIAALSGISQRVIGRDLTGPLASLRPAQDPFEIRIQRRYNPEGLARYNVVPGLIGVILTMTMVMMTALAMTRERERGTMENLLATPARPIEVMIGKIVPYILIGYVQVTVILLASWLLFDVPMVGSLVLLSAVLVVFIAANLAVGFTFSTIARNQLQAMQLTFFFFLPSMLLTGFMFPFRGMP